MRYAEVVIIGGGPAGMAAALAARQAQAAHQTAQTRDGLGAAHQGQQLLAEIATQPGTRPDRPGRLLHRLYHRAAQGPGWEF